MTIRLALECERGQCMLCICCLGFGVLGQHSINLDMVAYDGMALCLLLHRLSHGKRHSNERIFISVNLPLVLLGA